MLNRCSGCGRVGATPLRVHGQSIYGYLLCQNCGTGRIDPEPAPAAAETYDSGYFVAGGARAGYADYEADETWHRRTARTRLGRVADALSGGPGGRLVDVGGAVGFLADEARRLGWEPTVVESSRWAGERAAARSLPVVPALADLEELAGTVDAVTFFQSLEHMPDPQQALREAACLLRPGGVVVIESWDVTSRAARLAGRRWQQLSPPSVLWLFSPQGLAGMVHRAGLTTRSWRPTGKLVSAATVVGQSVGDRAPGLARLLQPVLSGVGVPYFLDDLVTCVAARPERRSRSAV